MNTELENAIRRGDEFFDENDRLHKANERLEEVNDSLADRLRDRDNVIAALHGLLNKNNIDYENLSEFGYSYEDEEE